MLFAFASVIATLCCFLDDVIAAVQISPVEMSVAALNDDCALEGKL